MRTNFPNDHENLLDRVSGRRMASIIALTAQRLYETWVLRQKRAAIRWLIIFSITVVLLWLFMRLRDVLIPFGIAFFLAALLDPVVHNIQRGGPPHPWIARWIPSRFLRHGGRPRGWAVGSIFALFFCLMMLIAILTARFALPQMKELAENAQTYQNQLTTWGDDLYAKYKIPLKRVGIEKNPIHDTSGPLVSTGISVLESLKAASLGLVGQVLWLIIVPLSLFYFLLDYPTIRAKLIGFVPFRYRSTVDKMSLEIVEIFSAYVRGLAKVCALYAVSASILFTLFGLRYALFLGMAAGVLYAVPYVGPAIAMATAAIIALASGGSAVYAIAVVAVFAAMHVGFDYVLTPRVVGGSVGLHPLVNVFALMAGATLFGVWGMLLAVPVAASIQMILVYFFPRLAEKPVLETDNVGVVMAEEAGEEREVVTSGLGRAAMEE